MNTWSVSSETGEFISTPSRVCFSGKGVALMLPASSGVLSQGVWCLSAPGTPLEALYRTVSTRRAATPGMMVLRGVRMVDEGRSVENRTIRLIRELLDLDGIHAPMSCAGVGNGDFSGKEEQVRRGSRASLGRRDGSCA